MRTIFQNKSKDGKPARLNCTEILIQSGLNRPRARVVKHYLKELGLARTTAKVAGTREWLWVVKTTGEVKVEALTKIIEREGGIHNPTKDRVGPYHLEDTRHERQFAGRTPAILPGGKCGPVVKTTTPSAKKDAESEATESQIRQLLNLARTLEAKNKEAEERIRELETEVANLKAKLEGGVIVSEDEIREVESLLQRHRP
jgi:hypothetical protein